MADLPAIANQIVGGFLDAGATAGDAQSGCFIAIDGGMVAIFPLPDDLSYDANYGWNGQEQGAVDAFVEGYGGEGGLTGGLSRAAGAAGTGAAVGALGEKISGAAGITVNPREELIFDAPRLRSFSLSFNISSKSMKRMEQKIIQLNALYAIAAPGLDESGNTFTLPPKATLTIRDSGKKVIRDRQVAITGISTNLTPDGAFNTFVNGIPMHIRVTISFIETIIPTVNTEANIFLGT